MLDIPELTRRIGGPLGRHAKRSGVWFAAAPFAFLGAGFALVIAILRQLPCRPNVNGDYPNAFLRLCYTDIPSVYLRPTISSGEHLYQPQQLEYPVVVGYFISFVRWLTSLVSNVSPQASASEKVHASQVFLIFTIILLAICWLCTVAVHLLLANRELDADGVKIRAWDAAIIAVSPIVILNAFINWDLLAVFLTSLALLYWVRKSPGKAGIFLGLGFATKFYPIIVLAAIWLLAIRAGKWRAALITSGTAVAAWAIVNFRIVLTAFTGWQYYWTFNQGSSADLGSLWYVLELLGITVPYLSLVSFTLMAIAGLGVVYLVLKAPKRPRLAQVVLLLLIVFMIFNKVYSPQYALWLLPFVALSRPKFVDMAVWTLAEAIYWVSIWGFLEGIISIGTGAEWIYWAAVMIRIIGQLWIALRVIEDIFAPWQDPVRTPFVDDPLGGVFDHAVDRIWLKRA